MKQLVGPGRFELPTSPLSGVRSNQLSYGPDHVHQTRPSASLDRTLSFKKERSDAPQGQTAVRAHARPRRRRHSIRAAAARPNNVILWKEKRRRRDIAIP